MDKTIKKGYHIEVTTWENDGDNYKTETTVVQTHGEVEKLLPALQLFSKSHTAGHFGNADCWPTEPLEEAAEPLGYCHDSLVDIVGTWCDGEYWRNVDSVKVYYVPEDVVFEEIPGYKL